MKEDLENYKKTIEAMTRELVDNHGIKDIEIAVDIVDEKNIYNKKRLKYISVDLYIKT